MLRVRVFVPPSQRCVLADFPAPAASFFSAPQNGAPKGMVASQGRVSERTKTPQTNTFRELFGLAQSSDGARKAKARTTDDQSKRSETEGEERVQREEGEMAGSDFPFGHNDPEKTMLKLSRDQIERGRTPKGGWTKEQLAKWGVHWPPAHGWQYALMNGLDPNKAPASKQKKGTDQMKLFAGDT